MVRTRVARESLDGTQAVKCLPQEISLREYVMAAQHWPHITQYVKQENGSWSYQEVNELSASLYLPSVDCVLELSEVYRDVTFPATPLPNLREPS